MDDVLYSTLDGHLATLGLRFGLRWGSVRYKLVALSAVRPAVAMLDGVDVALTHAELSVSMSTVRGSGPRTYVPTAPAGGVLDPPAAC